MFALSKLKAFADDNFSLAQMVQFFIDRVENIMGKGEHAGYQHFLLFPQCFQKVSFPGALKGSIVRKRVNEFRPEFFFKTLLK